jgi:transcriptional regulator
MAQATGTARLRDEPDWVAAQLADLTGQQEAGRPAPWAPSDAPEDFLVAQMRAIVGLEIAVEDLRGKFKLSQNRAERDRLGVMAGLAREAAPEAQAMAAIMRAKQPTDGPEAHS